MADEGKRRRRHGSAWHWKQTDGWYYTVPGTKRREPLRDEQGQRIRGKENRQAAELALARLKLAGRWRPAAAPALAEEWLVARVAAEYIAHCRQAATGGTMSRGYSEDVVRYLNALCVFCGALPAEQLRPEHVRQWIADHPSWRSPATQRNVMTIVLAAFNHIEKTYDRPNPLKGLKKPPARPRLHSLSPADEQALLDAADDCFRDFLLAAIHTGLRPFCELARLTAEDVEETPRGTLWRVYSTKTKKTRKIPVRPEVAQLTARLLQTAPRGSGLPLLRNPQGRPWKKPTAVCRFLALKRKLGWQDDPQRSRYSCYTCRHTFAHRMLSGYWNGGAGCSIEVLAELIGDTPKVAFDHYGREWGQHYQEPLWAALGCGLPAGRGQSFARHSAGR